jgi:hypothetical protein
MSRGATLTTYSAALVDLWVSDISAVSHQPGETAAAHAATWNSHEGAFEPFSSPSISVRDPRLEDRSKYAGLVDALAVRTLPCRPNLSEWPIVQAHSLMIG